MGGVILPSRSLLQNHRLLVHCQAWDILNSMKEGTGGQVRCQDVIVIGYHEYLHQVFTDRGERGERGQDKRLSSLKVRSTGVRLYKLCTL